MTLYCDQEGFAEVTALCHSNHARLLAHCRNNFLKALEALKAEHESWIGLWDRCGNEHIPKSCETCALIKELEEVKA